MHTTLFSLKNLSNFRTEIYLFFVEVSNFLEDIQILLMLEVLVEFLASVRNSSTRFLIANG